MRFRTEIGTRFVRQCGEKRIESQFIEFEFAKTFLLNSEKPKADSPNCESSKAEFWKIVSRKARITNLILGILKTRKNDEFVILAFEDLIIQGVSKVFLLFLFEKYTKKL